MAHARHMDAVYRVQRHIYDATRKYYLLGRDDLIAGLAPPPGSAVLEIGCGTGRNLIAAARAWPDVRFYGIDISEEMLVTARAKVAKAGFAHRITLAAADAAAFDPAALFGVARFDRIFHSYTLSMIPDWQVAIAEAADKLAPGGRLDIVDFGQQERLPRWWRGLLFAWLRHFSVTPRAGLERIVATTAARRDQIAEFRPLRRGYAWAAAVRAR